MTKCSDFLKKSWPIGTFLLSTVMAGATAYAGADSSGGGDSKTRDPGNAWFVGRDKVIRACVEIAPDFGVNREFAEHQIVQAFETWRTYMEKKLKRRKADLTPASRVQIGSCATADLTFYLGIENEATQQAALAYQNPTAMAHRTSYDQESGWGRGFIWVKSRTNWGFRDHLRAVLLHEIGHVLGNAHVFGTIMDEGIVSRLGTWGDYEGPHDLSRLKLTEIDQRHELILCGDCETTHYGIISQFTRLKLKKTEYDLDELKKYKVRLAEDTFRLFTGRTPVGRMFTRWNYLPAPESWPSAAKSTLVLKDQAGEVAFPIRMMPPVTIDFSGFLIDMQSKAFFVEPIGSDFNIFSISEEGGKPMTLHGKIKAKSGKEFVVVIERNSQMPSPVRILYLDSGRGHELMVSGFANDPYFDPYED